MKNFILENLNETQKEAVLQTEGPLLVLAGAGSGKTKTLTHRIANLICEKKVSPYKILAVTFTNKAANEMEFRVAALLEGQGPRAKILGSRFSALDCLGWALFTVFVFGFCDGNHTILDMKEISPFMTMEISYRLSSE